jgi:hypothetical protein
MSASAATSGQGPVYPEPPYKFILDRLRKGKVIPFLGAGASLVGRAGNAGWSTPELNFLPSARELSTYLVDKIGYPSSDLELTRVAQYFDVVGGSAGLGDELHYIFAKDYGCGSLHDFLTRFPCPLIVTTNYDDLMEAAFRKRGLPFHRVIYRTGNTTFFVWEHDANAPKEVHPNEMGLKLGPTPVIYKMHGAADISDKNRDSYVITEDNYVEFLARIAQESAIPAVIAECFRESHFLFLGYGLRDWNLRVILHEIWRKWRRRYGSWAIQHTPAPLEYQFWLKRDLTIYDMSIDDFLARLSRAGAPDGSGEN